jgi:hypothetical protein
MSYTTIAQCADDQAFAERVTAATVTEAWNNPALVDNDYAVNVRASITNAHRMTYPVAVASGNPNPGGDPAVITDGMILANVQAKWVDDPTAP